MRGRVSAGCQPEVQPDAQAAAVSRKPGQRGALRGAAGGGKSYAICWDAFMRCLRYPKTDAGVRTESWTSHTAHPRCCLYSIGLSPPNDSLMRLQLYQLI